MNTQTQPLRTLHVGVGNRGKYLLQEIQKRNDYAPVALMDPNPEFLEDARQLTGVPGKACFSNLEDALRYPGLEACVITSPAKFHGAQVKAALNRGLHVFLAKPMTYNFAEGTELVEISKRQNLVLLVDQQQRFMRTERIVAEWIRENKYGSVGYGAFTLHRYRPTVGAFTGIDPFIWEQGIHSFDSLRAMLGREAIAVTAHQMQPSWSNYNGATTCMGLIEFEGDLPVQYLGTFESRQFELEIRLECEQAALRMTGKNFTKYLSVAHDGNDFVQTGISDDQDERDPEHFNLDNFHLAARTGCPVPNDGEDNLRSLAIADAYIRSVHQGKRVKVAQV